MNYERLRALALFRNTPIRAESKPFSATVWFIRIFGRFAEIPNFWNQRTALSRLHLAHVQNSTQIAQQRVVLLFCFTFASSSSAHIAHRPLHTYIYLKDQDDDQHEVHPMHRQNIVGSLPRCC